MTEPLLVARGVAKRYDAAHRGAAGGTVRALDGVDFDLAAGELVALVGESGSGKSTLLSLIAGLEAPTAGEIRFAGRSIGAFRRRRERREFRRRVQLVFQDPYESLDPRQTIGQVVAESLEVHGIGTDRAERAERVANLLEEVGLAPAATFVDRRPAELSGGQRQRVAIAAALAVEPKLLLADEPVSMLDVSVRAEILNLLARLQRDRGIAVVLVTHDLATAAAVSERIAVLYLGRIVEQGPPRALLAGAAHPYTRALIAACPVADPAARNRERVVARGEAADASSLPAGCRYHPRCPRAEERCRGEEPPLRDLGGGRLAACHFAEDVARA